MFTTNSNVPSQSGGGHIPYGWIILGVFLMPVLVLLVWANYQLLSLGLEAVFGFNRIEWTIMERVITIQDVIATATIAGELLAGFLFAELAGWINLLNFDDRLQVRQRGFLKWIALMLFFALAAGEVGIAIYRQSVIDRESRKFSEKLAELSIPTSSQSVITRSGEIDLTKNSSGKRIQEPTSSEIAPPNKTEPTLSGWASFVDSLPTAATVFIHVAIPCLATAIGVIASPLTFFLCGLALTLTGPMPLSLLCIVLDLGGRVLNGGRMMAVAILNLIAAPTRILIEAIINWRQYR